MRNRSREIDAKIARYRQMSADVNDNAIIILLNTFIADLETERAELHSVTNE